MSLLLQFSHRGAEETTRRVFYGNHGSRYLHQGSRAWAKVFILLYFGKTTYALWPPLATLFIRICYIPFCEATPVFPVKALGTLWIVAQYVLLIVTQFLPLPQMRVGQAAWLFVLRMMLYVHGENVLVTGTVLHVHIVLEDVDGGVLGMILCFRAL